MWKRGAVVEAGVPVVRLSCLWRLLVSIADGLSMRRSMPVPYRSPLERLERLTLPQPFQREARISAVARRERVERVESTKVCAQARQSFTLPALNMNEKHPVA